MELTDKEIKLMIIEYYKTFDKLDDLTHQICKYGKELDEILESLTLSSQKLSDMPKGNEVSSPVERIMEEFSKIKSLYEQRAYSSKVELQNVLKKQNMLKKWLDDSKMTETEKNVIKYMYKDGFRDWKIGNIIGYDSRTIRRYKKSAIEKLSKSCPQMS